MVYSISNTASKRVFPKKIVLLGKALEMFSRKISILQLFCFLLFLGVTQCVTAIELSTAQYPLNAKDHVISGVKDSVPAVTTASAMPVFKPNPKIDYKILEAQVNPNIDYKILKTTLPSNPVVRKNTAPKLFTDSPIPQLPKIQKPLNPVPHDFQQNQKLPENKPENN